MTGQQDIWSQWLLNRRFGGDPQRVQAMLERLYPIRDKVLSHVDLREGGILLDVGCGDGLISFGALEKFPGSRVIFSDVSQDLLDHVRARALERRLEPRCQFLQAAADDLSALGDGSVDAVTTRSVLIYVQDKARAFSEFHRVLKPGGRLSIFEPINRFAFPEPADRFAGYDMTPVLEIAQKLKDVYDRIQPPETDPMTDFDERDLIQYAEQAGFREVHLELKVKVTPSESGNWEAILKTAANPRIPTLEEAMAEALSPAEAEVFIGHLRPLVEARQGINRTAVAYQWAVK